ncbi:MAG: TauD/TfdA family dioxygenase [Cyanobacteria bacterium P01_C01_bin.72]
MQLQINKRHSADSIAPEQFVTVRGTRFHYIWLRENCPSCRHTAPLQQLYDPKISDRPENPQPLSVELTEEQLIIEWDETPAHRSFFSLDWLLENAYDPQPPEKSKDYILWERKQLELEPPQAYDVRELKDDSWMNQLFTRGFVVLKHIPPSALASWLSAIGPIYNIDYGTIFALNTETGKQKLKATISHPPEIAPEKVSETVSAASSPQDGCALPAHNDLSYWGGHRLAQFLYCVEHQAIGGESILVDGFRIAEDFRQDYPHYFQLLVETPVQFWLLDQNHQYLFCNTAPILECDRLGNLTTVRFSKRNCRPQLPFAQLEDFYQAYNTFFRYLKNPAYQYQFCLEPQDCLLFQNFRILHGRTAFNPASGKRKLNAGYLDWNFFVGRKNFVQL